MSYFHRILFEDEHLLAANKLSGELVVRGKGKMEKLPLFDFLKKDHPGLHTLHRLDLDTSGIVLFAKTKEAEKHILDSKFYGWKKLYRALVMGRIMQRDGIIRFPLPARTRGKVQAVTRYCVLDRFANSSLIEAEIETGRHHQIRRHFAGIKHPLVLDSLYGHKKFNGVFTHEFGYKKFFLHASSLTIPHPITQKTVRITAPLPRAFQEIVELLGSLG